MRINTFVQSTAQHDTNEKHCCVVALFLFCLSFAESEATMQWYAPIYSKLMRMEHVRLRLRCDHRSSIDFASNNIEIYIWANYSTRNSDWLPICIKCSKWNISVILLLLSHVGNNYFFDECACELFNQNRKKRKTLASWKWLNNVCCCEERIVIMFHRREVFYRFFLFILRHF